MLKMIDKLGISDEAWERGRILEASFDVVSWNWQLNLFLFSTLSLQGHS
ncbi:hypothetical protein [Sporosarcina sp. E16_8]|nr:hypothetical protein [Sporosarcina sp. E16_8]MBO0586669.1 hypothetical protein [Sporosarcina sp. E16_8]